MPQTKTYGPIRSPNIVYYHYFGNLVCFCDVHEYIEWESKIDNIFAQCRMCEQRKIKNASSVL